MLFDLYKRATFLYRSLPPVHPSISLLRQGMFVHERIPGIFVFHPVLEPSSPAAPVFSRIVHVYRARKSSWKYLMNNILKFRSFYQGVSHPPHDPHTPTKYVKPALTGPGGGRAACPHYCVLFSSEPE